MPKKYKDKKNQKFENELTPQELNEVKKVEDFIDDEIDLQWQNGRVFIDKCIVQFKCDPQTHNPTGFLFARRKIMSELLFSKYEDADWWNGLAVNGQWSFYPMKK